MRAKARLDRDFAEDMGIFFEDYGQPRMAGRIFGILLIADPPEMSSADLAALLSASSGSVSTMTRHLIRLGMVERVGAPGERRNYFRARPAAWRGLLEERLGLVQQMHRLAERGIEVAEGKSPEVRRRLEALHEFYEFMDHEVQGALKRWEKLHR